jgi:hypothetical protein
VNQECGIVAERILFQVFENPGHVRERLPAREMRSSEFIPINDKARSSFNLGRKQYRLPAQRLKSPSVFTLTLSES